jgi:very-short-patch-repair endonuclease
MLLNNGIKCKFHYKIGPYEADYLLNDDIVLELDGPMHGTKKDERKDKYLRRMGYKVVRIPIWVLANDPKAVISAIQEL